MAASRVPFPTPAAVSVSSPSSAAGSLSLRSLFLALPTHHLRSRPHSLTARRPRTAVVAMSMEAGVGVMGTKLGMMSYFDSDGTVVPVTVVGFREGNIVTQVKTTATDGYDAVQVGYRRVRDRKLTKPELGHLEKASVIALRHLQEFRLQSVEEFEPGQRLAVEEVFKEGDLVDVSRTTIGKGFQGGIKRHHFHRGPMSHGSKSHRALGSIGAGTTPGRVYKGKKMPGRMGGTNRKISKLKIVKIDYELRVVMIKGAVPEQVIWGGDLLPRRDAPAPPIPVHGRRQGGVRAGHVQCTRRPIRVHSPPTRHHSCPAADRPSSNVPAVPQSTSCSSRSGSSSFWTATPTNSSSKQLLDDFLALQALCHVPAS